ncbi:MAG: hypothetical protein KC457_28690 [Myxococcales bacterium]|nr:hypothetical protein [Myxococcales bacterium]
MIALALTLDHFGAEGLLAQVVAGRMPSLAACLALGYLGTGAAMAWHLSRRGHSLGTVTSALACWPLLLGLIGRQASGAAVDLDALTRREAGPPGPYAVRIDGCLSALHHTLHEEPLRSASPVGYEQIDKLGAALHRADRRLARIDRLIDETEIQRRQIGGDEVGVALVAEALASLRRAREHSRAELDAVLAGLLQLRVQLGLYTLAGEGEGVRERLAEIEARVAALAELSSVDLRELRS